MKYVEIMEHENDEKNNYEDFGDPRIPESEQIMLPSGKYLIDEQASRELCLESHQRVENTS